MTNVKLMLIRSDGTRTELGRFDAHGENGTITESVHLPASTEPGRAQLRLGVEPASLPVRITITKTD